MVELVADFQPVLAEVVVGVHVYLFKALVERVGDVDAVFKVSVAAVCARAHTVCEHACAGYVHVFALDEHGLAYEADANY